MKALILLLLVSAAIGQAGCTANSATYFAFTYEPKYQGQTVNLTDSDIKSIPFDFHHTLAKAKADGYYRTQVDQAGDDALYKILKPGNLTNYFKYNGDVYSYVIQKS